MQRGQAHKSSHRRSTWWSAALSLLLALSLVVRPGEICALLESSPAHAAASHSHASGVSDESSDCGGHAETGSSHHDSDNHHAAPASIRDGVMAISPTNAPHLCCSDISAPRPALILASRALAPDESSELAQFSTLDTLPTPDVFAVSACRNRDGPRDKLLRSQLVSSSLSGRAPPAFV